MKRQFPKILLFCILLLSFKASKSLNYYFSIFSGNDSRTAAQAQNSSTPWKTLTKLNAFLNSLQPGDSVLFKCGEIFYGSVAVTKSGSSIKPIVFGSYGTGASPVLSGLVTLSNWVSIGNGIYESYNSSFGPSVNTVVFNGKMQSMGRYPNINASNKGFLIFESHTANSITDLQLNGSTNWTGAEVVIRSKRWILDRSAVTAHSGNTLSFSQALSYNPYDNYGYFIQNHIKTLDQLGEWYYNPSTKKLDVFFGSNIPSSYSVQASVIGTIITVNSQNNITFYNLEFQGSNSKAFDLYYAQNISIQSCIVKCSGVDGIDASATTNLCVKNTYFNYTNNNAIDLNYSCNNSVIRYNYVANTGMAPGMGGGGNSSYQAITITGANNLLEYNTIYNTGYAAIRYSGGSGNVIKNNFINYFTLTKDDGGGIYGGEAKNTNYTGTKITGNIVLNGLGAPEGTDRTNFYSSSGIFLDDNCTNIDVTYNTVYNCGRSGILIHNSFNSNVLNNTLYNNSTQLTMIHDYGMPNALLRNMVVKNNICLAKVDSQYACNVRTEANDISLLGIMDSNYFCRPIDDNLTMVSTCTLAGARVDRYQDLAGWQAIYNLDKSSVKSPVKIPPYVINSLGPNLYSNGTFNTSITGLYSNPVSSWVNNKLDGGTYQAKNNFSTTASNFQVIVGVGAINANKNYILRFSSQSSRDTLLSAFLRLSGSPYSYLSDVKTIPIFTHRAENEYLFSLPAACPTPSIIFSTKCPGVTFWLDNLEFRDANVSITDPEDYFVFEYNASQKIKTFDLPAGITYVDAQSNAYFGTVVIQPYSSVVLVKQTPGSMLYSFNKVVKQFPIKKYDRAMP